MMEYVYLMSKTCHSAMHRSFSRIDLTYAVGVALPIVKDIKILPRGI